LFMIDPLAQEGWKVAGPSGKTCRKVDRSMKTTHTRQGSALFCFGDSLPPASNPSGLALPTDRNTSFRHNHRYLAFTFRIAQHRFQFFRGRKDVDVLKILVLIFVSFPSCRGERSCVFTKNQYLVRHLFPPEPKTPRGVQRIERVAVRHSQLNPLCG